jgi:hypothetical protein
MVSTVLSTTTFSAVKTVHYTEVFRTIPAIKHSHKMLYIMYGPYFTASLIVAQQPYSGLGRLIVEVS